MKKIFLSTLKWLLPLLIAAAILIYVYRDFDFATVWDILRHDTRMAWLWISLLPILLSHILRGVRWLQTLEPLGYRPRTINSVLSIYLAYASNIIIPRVGEVSRCGVLLRYDGVPFTKSLGTLVAERVVDFIIAFSYCGVMFLLFFDDFAGIFTGSTQGGLVALLTNWRFWTVAVAAVGGAWLLWHFFRQSRPMQKISHLLRNFGEGFISLGKVRRLWLFLLLTAAIWFCYYLEFYLCFFAFPFTAALTPLQGAVIFAAISVAIIIPTPNGAGPWHFVVTSLLVASCGVLEPQAASFALIVHTFQTLFVLLFGAVSWILLQIFNRQKS